MNPEGGGGCPKKHGGERAWVDHMDDSGHGRMYSPLGRFGPYHDCVFPVAGMVYIIVL